MTYAYARVSSAEQNLDRQIDAFHAQGLTDEQIVGEKKSGKDFENRTEWKRLFKRLRKGDLLMIKSLDRLGRNYAEIIEEWRKLTKVKGVDVVVLDMPILDTRESKNLIGRFIADIVLQILSFVAETERANIKARQMEGIKSAKARGVKFGRPKVKRPADWRKAVGDAARKAAVRRRIYAAMMCRADTTSAWLAKCPLMADFSKSIQEMAREMGCSDGTLRRWMMELEAETKNGAKE